MNNSQAIKEAFNAHHPLHGVFANVYERLGGEEFIYQWAKLHHHRLFIDAPLENV